MDLKSLDKNLSVKYSDKKVVQNFFDTNKGFAASLLESILNFCPGKVYWKDLNGIYLGCSLDHARSLGYSQDFIIGKNDFDFFTSEEAAKLRKNDTQVIEAGEKLIIKESVTIKGVSCLVKSVKSPLRDDLGSIIGVIGISTDILDNQPLDNEKKVYVAKIKNISTEEKFLTKSKSCFLPISLGQSYHEDEKLRAALKMVQTRFKSCFILLADTLQRYNEALNYGDDVSEEKVREIIRKKGDQWLERNIEMINKELKIPYKIVRWNELVGRDDFYINLAKLKDAYNNNSQYFESVRQSANQYFVRLNSHTENLSKEKITTNAINYILEESACIAQLFDYNLDYFVYPNKIPDAINFAFDILRPNDSKKFLKNLRIKFSALDKDYEPKVVSKIAIEEICEMLPGNIYWKDPYGVILGANLQQARSLGFDSVASLVGKTEFDVFSYDDAQSIRKQDIAVMSSRRGVSVTEETVKISKKIFTFLSYKSCIKDKNDKTIGLLGVSLDITKQKEAEKKLYESNDKLSKALEAKKIFLSNVGHEIRTPLSNILKISQLLYEDWEKYPTNQARKAHLKMAVDGNKRLENVLANLLDLSCFEAGKLRYDMRINSFVESVEGVISEFVDKKHRIDFRFDCDKNFSFVFDRFRIEQVIRNLLANALKYGKDKNVLIELKNEGGFAYFSITDQGIGVPEDELEEIFKIFIQGTRTAGSGGTGSGLAISRTIIKDHGGLIWAQNSVSGIGSTFTFKIPLEDNKKADLKLNESISDIFPRVKESRIPNLLLIDDESSILQVSKLVFEKMGFNVTLADSGHKGLEMLSADLQIDVVLLDMMLPDLSGVNVLNIIKKDERMSLVPVYIYSGMGLEEEIENAIAAGAEGFIDKTSNSRQIEKVLGKFLKNLHLNCN